MAISYRVGVIGCGSIAQRHVKAYQSVPGFHLAAATEPNVQRANAFQNTFAIPTMYADPEEMLQQRVAGCNQHLHLAWATCIPDTHGS